MNDQEISSDKLSSKVNALIIIDIQEKIIRPIFNKDSIIKNIKKLINAYQILEENIFISEQNPLKLGVTIPEFGFPGLKDGDGWCLCASWYARAVEAGKGCPIFLKRTHENTLKYVPIETLKKFAIDLS